jgi:hypothetical protein
MSTGNKEIPASQAFMALLVVPASYFITFPLAVVVGKVFVAIVGDLGQLAVNLLMFLFSFGILVGDPVLFVLNKIKPGLLPVQKFNIVNFSTILFVLDPSKM